MRSRLVSVITSSLDVMILPFLTLQSTSGSIPAQAVFPETEFSKGAPEPQHPWREMPQNKPDLRGDHRELGDKHRDLPRNTLDNRTDRQDLRQDKEVLRRDGPQLRQEERTPANAGQVHQDQRHLRHDGQELRHDRQNLQADRQHRRGSRHKAKKNRSKTHDDLRDLPVDRRAHRDGPPRSIGPDRE